jgi:hypothetical protein
LHAICDYPVLVQGRHVHLDIAVLSKENVLSAVVQISNPLDYANLPSVAPQAFDIGAQDVLRAVGQGSVALDCRKTWTCAACEHKKRDEAMESAPKRRKRTIGQIISQQTSRAKDASSKCFACGAPALAGLQCCPIHKSCASMLGVGPIKKKRPGPTQRWRALRLLFLRCRRPLQARLVSARHRAAIARRKVAEEREAEQKRRITMDREKTKDRIVRKLMGSASRPLKTLE